MEAVRKIWRVEPFFSKALESIVLLLTRCYMFNVFYTSGKSKLDNFFNGDWETTVYLFEEIHPVPYLSSHLAAMLGTSVEVLFSCLLLFGLFSRFSALILLIVTAVIEISFTYFDPNYVTFESHYMWALLLFVILARGAGHVSLDAVFFPQNHKK